MQHGCIKIIKGLSFTIIEQESLCFDKYTDTHTHRETILMVVVGIFFYYTMVMINKVAD